MKLLKIGNGDFADVFELSDGSVMKAFRRLQHSGGDGGNWDDENAITRELFEAEVRAYERLQTLPELAVYTPQFLGRLDPCSFIGSMGSQANEYVSGCGICLERILGTDIKVGRLDEPRREVARIVLEQIEAAIKPGNVWDSSCFFPGSRADLTLIDFAVWDDLEDCSEILSMQGQFTTGQREQLKREHRLDRT